MTTREREVVVVRGCLACSIDDHHACSGAVEDDAGGWSTVYCCCGLAVDPKTTAAEYAAYAEELRGLGWSQPAGPGQQPEGAADGHARPARAPAPPAPASAAARPRHHPPAGQAQLGPGPDPARPRGGHTMTGLGEAALAYAAAGYAVFPLRGKLPVGNCPACEPRSPRYRPHQANECGHELCHGLYAATCDPARVTRWWARWPQANIGARVPASLLVVDVDPRHGGLGRLEELEREHGPLPATRVSVSGRGDGGRHLWFLHPGGRLSAVRLGVGVDLKTHAGYVLLPPSRHPATGQPYRWAEPTLAPAALPAAWWRLLAPAPLRPAPATRRPSLPAPARGRSVAEAFNQATSWTQVLSPHGWTCPDPDPDGARWRHPGATNPKSATIRHGLLFVYSAGTPFTPTEPGAPRGYSRFRAYAVLEHGGDLWAAARALRAGAR